MAVSTDGFRVRFPEFSLVPEATLLPYLEGAKRETNESVWLDLYEDGVYFLCAHRLSVTPFGMGVARATPTGQSPYGDQYIELRKRIQVGISRVC